ncbi:hypothetical protein Hanom_Chr16g01470471 [Helianthus anomalus]
MHIHRRPSSTPIDTTSPPSSYRHHTSPTLHLRRVTPSPEPPAPDPKPSIVFFNRRLSPPSPSAFFTTLNNSRRCTLIRTGIGHRPPPTPQPNFSAFKSPPIPETVLAALNYHRPPLPLAVGYPTDDRL